MADNTEKAGNESLSSATKISVAFYFHHRGGVELEALRFADWLDKQGRLGCVLCVCQEIVLVQQIAGNLSKRMVFLEFDGVIGFSRSVLSAIIKRLNVRSNAIVVHSWQSNWPLRNLFALRVAGFRLLVIEHQWSQKIEANTRLASKILMRLVVQRGIGVSSGARNTLKNCGIDGDRIQVIWNGTDIQRFRIDPEQAKGFRSAQGIGHDKLVFAYLGRLAKQKCVDKIIESFSKFRQSNARIMAELLIIGDGPEKAELQRAVKELHLEDCVSFLGWISEPETVLPAVDVLLLMSWVESFPLAVIEAMSCGCAVVCFDKGDIARLADGLEGVAILNSGPGKHEIPAAFIDDYLRDKERLRSENRRRIVELCDHEKIYHRYVEALDN